MSPIASENEGIADWPRFNIGKQATQILGFPIKTLESYKQETCDFWFSLYPSGIPYFGDGDEMVLENWKSFVINETGFFVLRNTKKALFVVGTIVVAVLVAIYFCCCSGSKTKKQKRE